VATSIGGLESVVVRRPLHVFDQSCHEHTFYNLRDRMQVRDWTIVAV